MLDLRASVRWQTCPRLLHHPVRIGHQPGHGLMGGIERIAQNHGVFDVLMNDLVSKGSQTHPELSRFNPVVTAIHLDGQYRELAGPSDWGLRSAHQCVDPPTPFASAP